MLSQKLKSQENAELIERIVVDTSPLSVRYALTEKGLTVAKLAEPVFLYTAVTEGLFSQPQSVMNKHPY